MSRIKTHARHHGFVVVTIAMVVIGLDPVVAQESLVGVWEAERCYSYSEATEVTIRQADDRLTAIVGNSHIDLGSTPPSTTAIRFELPSREGKLAVGRFRGQFNAEKKAVSGHWIHGILNGNTNYPVAVPLTFRYDGKGTWRAMVPAHRDALRFFLCVERNAEDQLTGFIRNPERNQGIRFGNLAVSVTGEKVTLSNTERDLIIEGRISNNNGKNTLSFRFPNFNLFDFTKIDTPEFHPAFAPTADQAAYQYHGPEQTNDGWRTGNASDQGMDAKLLTAMIQSIRATKTDSLVTPYIHSVLVARNGKLILESISTATIASTCMTLDQREKVSDQ